MNGLANMTRWKCKHGHILGVVRSEKADHYHITRLLLFRQAIDVETMGTLQDVDVIAVIESATDVRCSVCDATRTWWMGEAEMERLMNRMGLVVDGK